MNASLYGSKPKNSAFHCPPPYPSGSKGQLQAKAIVKRYERLLLMQLNVPMGHCRVVFSSLWTPGVRIEGRKFKKVG